MTRPEKPMTFEEWARAYNYDLTSDTDALYRSLSTRQVFGAWNARQPEIDAANAERDHAHECSRAKEELLDDHEKEIGRLGTELAVAMSTNLRLQTERDAATGNALTFAADLILEKADKWSFENIAERIRDYVPASLTLRRKRELVEARSAEAKLIRDSVENSVVDRILELESELTRLTAAIEAAEKGTR